MIPSPSTRATAQPESASRLVDEAVEIQRFDLPRSTAGTPSPSPLPNTAPSSAQLTGLAELRLFRDRLERIAVELTAD
jgi:hypothetical protein